MTTTDHCGQNTALTGVNGGHSLTNPHLEIVEALSVDSVQCSDEFKGKMSHYHHVLVELFHLLLLRLWLEAETQEKEGDMQH